MKEQLLATIEKSQQYTLQVAEAMPESGYQFKPTGVGFSFGELMQHVAYGIQWWEENYIKGKQADWNPPAVKNSKQSVLAGLNKSYDGLKKTIQKQTLSGEAINGVHATLDHITHHRGQAVLYLRGQGITPPEYTY